MTGNHPAQLFENLSEVLRLLADDLFAEYHSSFVSQNYS
jgi:hypothetical protein